MTIELDEQFTKRRILMDGVTVLCFQQADHAKEFFEFLDAGCISYAVYMTSSGEFPKLPVYNHYEVHKCLRRQTMVYALSGDASRNFGIEFELAPDYLRSRYGGGAARMMVPYISGQQWRLPLLSVQYRPSIFTIPSRGRA